MRESEIRFAGIHAETDAALLERGQLADGRNLEAETGALAVRRGFRRVHACAAPLGVYAWPTLIYSWGAGPAAPGSVAATGDPAPAGAPAGRRSTTGRPWRRACCPTSPRCSSA